MKLIKTYEEELKQNYLELHYKDMDEETREIVDMLSTDFILIGRREKEQKILQLKDIFYCEIVDRKCFCYLQNEVWQLNESLQDLLDRYEGKGLVRVSKSMLVNVYHVSKISGDLNARLRLSLDNREHIIVNRSYRNTFYATIRKLQKREEA